MAYLMIEETISAALERVYRTFSRYGRPEKLTLCSFCYEPAEVELYRRTPLREIPADPTRRLLWETGDHWDNVETYKHYLPRLLEGLAPPMALDDLYPGHIFETLRHHGFADWSEAERSAVAQFVDALEHWLFAKNELDPDWVEARQNSRIV